MSRIPQGMEADASVINAVAWADPMAKNGFRQAGGVAYVGAVINPLNLTTPRAFEQLLDWESKLPQACELELQLQLQPGTPLSPTAFPDELFSSGYAAGAYNGFPWDGGSPVITKYETGGGADARVFYSDTRPGRFSLGVQQRVRVSVARWLVDSGFVGSTLVVQGSIGPSRGTDADPPTYTANGLVPTAANRNLTAPPGAVWWDWQCSSGSVGVPVQVQCEHGDGLFYKDTTVAAPVVYPPSAPYPVIPFAGFNFINLGAVDAGVTVTFWVR